jgi:hypothetical protein
MFQDFDFFFFFFFHIMTGSGDSSVGIATGYGLDTRGSILGRGKRFLLLDSVHTDSVAHPASIKMGTGGPFTDGKSGGGRETDHSPPSSAESSRNSTPQYSFMVWCLIN